jgi:hypothetical protein
MFVELLAINKDKHSTDVVLNLITLQFVRATKQKVIVFDGIVV